jgi:D-hydroxyproline dehydrogenase subunit gamma
MSATRLSRSIVRGHGVNIVVDGFSLTAYAGENLAAALMASGVLRLRHSPRSAGPRGAFCLIGVCQECVVQVNGALRQACLVPIEQGLVVELKGPLG